MVDSEDGRRPSRRPIVATAEQGVVLLDGPSGTVATLTPEAAAATSENLSRAAGIAAQQRSHVGSDPVPLRGEGSER